MPLSVQHAARHRIECSIIYQPSQSFTLLGLSFSLSLYLLSLEGSLGSEPCALGHYWNYVLENMFERVHNVVNLIIRRPWAFMLLSSTSSLLLLCRCICVCVCVCVWGVRDEVFCFYSGYNFLLFEGLILFVLCTQNRNKNQVK